VAGFKNFITQNVEPVKNFIGKLFSADQLEHLSDIAAAEAKIVEYDGEKMAVFKDSNGQVHAVHPDCTHLKCTVAWNEAEQSWDCPCHGARYSVDGKVLTGPADKQLGKIMQIAEAKEIESSDHLK